MSAPLCAALAVPAAAFVAPAGPAGQGAATAATAARAAAPSAVGPAPARELPGGLGAAAAVCSGLAGAAAAAVARRRASVARRGWSYEPGYGPGQDLPAQPVFPQNVERIVPAPPNSHETLQGYVGADVEMGDGPWDPLGFSKLYDRNYDFNCVMVYPHVQWLREAEIKHGRVSMLAFVGMVVQQWWQIPGLPQQPDWVLALDECYASPVAVWGIVQISVFAAVMEGHFFPEYAWEGIMKREPGDFGFDPLKFSKRPGFDLKKKQLIELKNGRLAMIGVASMASNHVLPGSVPFLTGAYAVRPEAREQRAAAGFCGGTRPSAAAADAPGRTAARYTTQVILPALQWIKTGLKAGDLQATELRAKNLSGVDVLVGKDGSGKLFCVGNLCPHIGTPMSEGADVIGDVIVCPLHGSSFNVFSGQLIDWCVSPPIIGPLTGIVVEKKNLAVFEIRQSFFGGDIEVLVDTNARKAYEADYWKGVLDAQGKDDGTYY